MWTVIYKQLQVQWVLSHKLYANGLKFEEMCQYETKDYIALIFPMMSD